MTDKAFLEKDFELPEEQFYFLYSVVAEIANNDITQERLKALGMYKSFKERWDSATVEERKSQLTGMYQLSVQAAEMALVSTNIIRMLGGADLIVAEPVPDAIPQVDAE